MFVVVGECVVGLGKWKMGKDIGCGYFLKITTIKLEGRKRLGSTNNYSIIIINIVTPNL